MPWLVWLSELSTGLQTKGSPVWFPVRAHAWVAGQVPSRGRSRGNHTLMFLFLSFLLPSPLKINKIFKSKYLKNVLIHALLPDIWSILGNVPCALEKNMYFAGVVWNVLYMSVRSSQFIGLFKSSISLLTYVVALFISWKWKSPPIFELSLFSLQFCYFFFIQFGDSLVRYIFIIIFFYSFTFNQFVVLDLKVSL